MAIIYQAELSPTKPEVLRRLLASRPWGEAAESSGELEVLGAYRFDDPAGEVGIECHLVRLGESVYHLPVTYRGAPLEDPAAQLVTTMEHSVLGTRYVYDGLEDELAIECFARALAGEQEQAAQEIFAPDGTPAGIRPQSVVLRLETDEGEHPPRLEELLEGDESFTIARTVDGLDGAVRLVAAWDGGQGVVAAC
jgi:hypothetical protein